jgi:crotonobetainyl-CoA:carnitine CoA-transferase CaiB-like acyl-CoA transferase
VPGPMSGVTVVELGFWVAAPSAAGILADWGAEVIKIEPPAGDPMRGLLGSLGSRSDINAAFELDNRGKRSICLDVRTPEGIAVALALTDRADAFVSNLRTGALGRLGLDTETLLDRNPRLVYAAISGYGHDGPDADRPAYDVGAFWARGGLAHSMTTLGQPPPMQRGGMGDHLTGLTAAAGVAAALFARDRTGVGQVVSTSLLRVAAYTLGWDLNQHVRAGSTTTPARRDEFVNPLINPYRAGDGRWFWLLGLQSDRHWPDLLRALDRPDLLDDARFGSLGARAEHAAELISCLDELFAKRDLHEWAAIFDREGVWWAPVRSVDDLASDPQAAEAGAFVDTPVPDGLARMVATPVDFSSTAWAPTRMTPELGQHTEEVLLELGYGWDDIHQLATAGVIP